jgi:hypothetical protein
MIHTSYYRPVVIPVNGDTTKNEIDRLQDLSATVTLNRNKVKEIGRDGIVGWRSNIPTVNVTLKQLEYGNIAFWNELANLASTNTVLSLNDFKTSMVDIAGYKTDDTGTFLGTVQYPKLRLSSFGLSIGDPQALAERSFTLVGEDEYFWQNSNKYLIFLKDSTCTTTSHSIVIGSGAWANYPVPIIDPDISATYIQKVVRVRAGVSTELVAGTDYSYTSGTQTIDVSLSGTPSVSGDIYKVWYTAGSYITASDPFAVNDSDALGVAADCCSIYLETSNYVYRLQSVGIDVSFDRNDLKEIGNSEIVTRGIRNKTVSVTLGRTLEAFTIEEILRGKTGLSWGKLNPRQFGSHLKLTVKMYTDSTKSTFLLGYSTDGLGPTSLDAGVPLDDYATRGVKLESDALTITNVQGSL